MKKNILFLILLISKYGFSQNPYYDSTKNLTIVSTYGNIVKNFEVIGKFKISKDTFKMSVKDSGSIVVKNGSIYIWNGFFWKNNSNTSSSTSIGVQSVSGSVVNNIDPLNPTITAIQAISYNQPIIKSAGTSLYNVSIDTGRNINQIVTGYSLNKIKDSLPKVLSFSKNFSKDSLILLLSSGARYAAKDSFGGSANILVGYGLKKVSDTIIIDTTYNINGSPTNLTWDNTLANGSIISQNRTVDFQNKSLSMKQNNSGINNPILSLDRSSNVPATSTYLRLKASANNSVTPFTFSSSYYPGVNADGSNNHVWTLCTNATENGGVLIAGKPQQGFSFEQDFQQSTFDGHQSEGHWVITDTAGIAKRFISVNSLHSGKYTSNYFNVDKSYWINSSRTGYNQNGYFSIKNDALTDNVDIEIRGARSIIDMGGSEDGTVPFLRYNSKPIITSKDTILNIGTASYKTTTLNSNRLEFKTNNKGNSILFNTNNPISINKIYTNGINFGGINQTNGDILQPSWDVFAFKSIQEYATPFGTGRVILQKNQDGIDRYIPISDENIQADNTKGSIRLFQNNTASRPISNLGTNLYYNRDSLRLEVRLPTGQFKIIPFRNDDIPAQETIIQRMTKTQRNAIINPAIGLLVYVTDNGGYLSWYQNSWQKIASIID